MLRVKQRVTQKNTQRTRERIVNVLPSRSVFNPVQVVLVLMMVFQAMVISQSAFAQAPGAFSRLGFGARGMAMGNALIADGSGYTSPYYNPALAPYTARQTLQASVAFMTFDRQLEFLQFASPLPPVAGVAAGLIHAGVTDIDGRTSSGFHTENLSTDEYAVFLAFGLALGRKASIGLGLQVFRADFFEELEPVNSIGIDLGFSLQVTDRVRVGVVADDLLAKYSWDTSGVFSSGGKRTSDHFPLRIRVGASYTLLEGRARILGEYEARTTTFEYRIREIEDVNDQPFEVIDVEELQIHESRLRIGGEYQLADVFTLRAGLDRLGGAIDEARPSAGFLVAQPVGQLLIWFEYAFALEPYQTGTMNVLTFRLFL